MSAHGKGEGSQDQWEWPHCHKLVQCRQKWSKLLLIFFSTSLGSGASTAMGCCGVRGAGWVCAMYVQHLLVSHQLLSPCLRAASFCMGNVSLNLNFLLLFFFVAMEAHEPMSNSSCILSPASHVVSTPEGVYVYFCTREGTGRGWLPLPSTSRSALDFGSASERWVPRERLCQYRWGRTLSRFWEQLRPSQGRGTVELLPDWETWNGSSWWDYMPSTGTGQAWAVTPGSWGKEAPPTCALTSGLLVHAFLI